MDKTVESLKQDVHTDIQFVSDFDLLPFHKKHINRKTKFSIFSFLFSSLILNVFVDIVKKNFEEAETAN
jgi:hypothetical protein